MAEYCVPVFHPWCKPEKQQIRIYCCFYKLHFNTLIYVLLYSGIIYMILEIKDIHLVMRLLQPSGQQGAL